MANFPFTLAITFAALTLSGCKTRSFSQTSSPSDGRFVPFSEIPLIPSHDVARGSYESFKSDPVDFLLRHGTQGAPVKKFRIGNENFLLVNEPEFVREVYRNETKNFDDDKPVEQRGKFYKGMFHDKFYQSTGVSSILPNRANTEAWQVNRKPVVKGAHDHAVGAMKGALATQVESALTSLRKQVAKSGKLTIDVSAWVDDLSLRIVLQNLFGLSEGAYGTSDMAKINKSWHTISNHLIEVTMDPALHVASVLNALLQSPLSDTIDKLSKSTFLPPGYLAAAHDMRAAVERLVRAKQAQPIPAHSGNTPSDMLALLIAANQASDGTLTDKAFKQVVDEAITIILAGHETTSATIQWSLHLLSQGAENQTNGRPEEIQERLAGEGRDERSALSATQAVFNETLRIFPTIYINERQARRTVTVKVSKGADSRIYEIPAHTNVILSPLVIHRTAANWDKPDVFDIGRDFEAGSASNSLRFLPFGSGVHMCPGRHFASAVYLRIMSRFHAEFEYKAAPGNKAIVPVGGISLRPSQPVQLVLRNRT